MLVDFEFKNFRCFKEKTWLSLRAFQKGNKKYKSKYFPELKLYINNVALIYGANGSGKSTIINALYREVRRKDYMKASVKFIVNGKLYNSNKDFSTFTKWADDNLTIVGSDLEVYTKAMTGLTFKDSELLQICELYQSDQEFVCWVDNKLKELLGFGVKRHLYFEKKKEDKGVYIVNPVLKIQQVDKEVEIDFYFMSEGTKEFILYSRIIFEAIKKGKCLVFDNFGIYWHPLFTKTLIEQFNCNESGGQLIATINDVSQLNWLKDNIIKQDQIWFTERYSNGESELYYLAQFEKVREEALEPDYLRGTYGGIPRI